MKTTARFYGERLRVARLARGMTAATVAEVLGVSRGSVTHWEKDATTPRPDKLDRLAELLRLPVTHFLRPPPGYGFSFPRFRSLMSTTAKSREEAEARAKWFSEVYERLSRHLRWPAVDVPDLSEGRSFLSMTQEDVEEAAKETRQAWGMGMGPITDLLRLLESKGVMVTKFAFSIEKVEALSCIAAGRPLIALNTDSASAVRLRFDAAHELAHLVLHQGVTRSQYQNPSHHKLLESQAHRFAGAFLFPESSFVDEVYTLSPSALVSLKRRWGVSIQTIAVRARDLDLIDSERLSNLYRRFSKRGWRRREPLDNELRPESPTLLRRSLKLLLESRFTVDQLLYELPFGQSDLEVMASLPIGALTTGWGDAIELRPTKETKQKSQPSADAEVLSFPSTNSGH